MPKDHQNPGFSTVFFYGTLAVALLAYVISLRPTTVTIPGTDDSMAGLIDRWWDQLVTDSKMQSRAFDERFGSPFEKFPARIQNIVISLMEGKLEPKLSQPYYGEPLDVAALVRKFPEIRRISVSPALAAKEELYQRLFEGLYPVLVVEGGDHTEKLLAPEETISCTILGQTKEAQLVRCP